MKTSDLHVARVTLLLVGRSRRWLAPALLYFLWVGLVLANPGPVRANAVAVYPLFEVVVCWFAVMLGNADDDGHRELCTALVGSPGRLFVVRAASALAIGVVLSLFTALLLGALSRPRSFGPSGLVASLVLLLAATMFGVGIGGLLHRPLVRNIGITVVLASLALLIALLLPPVIAALRTTIDGSDAGAFGLLLAAFSFAALTTFVGHRLVARSR